MIGQNEERWREVCEQVAVEQDPKKLVELTTEIYRLLEEKRRRLQRKLWMPHCRLPPCRAIGDLKFSSHALPKHRPMFVRLFSINQHATRSCMT
jgi:hypothetical protein